MWPTDSKGGFITTLSDKTSALSNLDTCGGGEEFTADFGHCCRNCGILLTANIFSPSAVNPQNLLNIIMLKVLRKGGLKRSHLSMGKKSTWRRQRTRRQLEHLETSGTPARLGRHLESHVHSLRLSKDVKTEQPRKSSQYTWLFWCKKSNRKEQRR